MEREMHRSHQTGGTQEQTSDPLVQNDPWAARGPVSYGPAAVRPPQATQQMPYEGGHTSATGAEGVIGSGGPPPGMGNGGFNGEWFGNTLPSMNPGVQVPFGGPCGSAPHPQFPVHQAPYGVFPGNPLGGAGLQELMMMNMMWLMKGHGKGGSPETSSWHVPTPEKRRKRKGKRQEEEEEAGGRSEESEKDEAEEGERRPRRGRGPPGSDPSSDPTTPEASESSVHTSEVRSLLRRRARLGQERPKSSLGSVKIEEFFGDRGRYLKWKRAVQAQQELYKLEENELAMLIYLSTKKDARDCLDQMAISEYTRPGGLRLVWRLLDEAFGESEDELFERAETEFNGYRRLPGQSIATYIGQLKRLRAQYLRVDPETTISDRAWSQRMLNKASLSRRERLDVFFSAGGRYSSREIEVALRHRCGKVHEDERKLPGGGFSKPIRVVPRGGQKGKGKGFGKKKVFYTEDGQHEEEEGDEDEEDLEQDQEAYGAYLEGLDEEEAEAEELEAIEEEDELQEDELKEAWAAGWKARQQQADKKKFRGWKKDSPSKGYNKEERDKRKANSTCSSCLEVGHWKGDPECKNVKNGRDPPHRKKEVASPKNGSEANIVHYTYVVSLEKKLKTEKAERRQREEMMRKNEGKKCMNPMCGFPVKESDKFCSTCGTRVPGDERMAQDKRHWHLVNDDDDEDSPETVMSSESERKERTYRVSKSTMKEALGKSKRDEDENQKVKLAPEEVLAALPNMSKAEKKALKYSLLKEEEQIAWETYRHHRTELDGIGFSLDGRPSGASGSGLQSQMPIPPSQAKGDSKDVQAAHAKYEAHKKEDLPKKVKEKKLEEFRWSLYQSQLDGSRLVPSTCSPVPTTTQARCNHYFYDLRWSANGDGHYARCKKCDLKHVIYFNERHGVLMAKKEEKEGSEVFLARAPGEAIADSGCRCAVAGEHWHEAMQKELKERGLGWFEEKEHETFRFGSGEPEISYKAMIYPVGIHGVNDVVRISMVGGGAIDCPGLLGPSELARWKAVAKFAERQLELKGISRPMRMTATRHPAIDLLEYAKNTSEENFWKDEEIKNTVRVLQRCPQAWAFHADKSEAEDEDQESEEGTEYEGEEEEEEEKNQDHWRKWMKKLDEHLHELYHFETSWWTKLRKKRSCGQPRTLVQNRKVLTSSESS